jgi:outer membrane protein OmpA-like peptidoglycan-associated protein
MKIALLIMSLVLVSAHDALSQVGREYGDGSTPRFVSHLPRRYYAMTFQAGKSTHTMFSRIICFRRGCRKIIARMKRTHSISFEEFTRKIRKNAKKGVYKSYLPVPPDTTRIKMKVEQIAKDVVVVEEKNEIAAPLLKTDSLVTLSEVLFETNSFKLNTEHLPTLDSLAAFLLQHATLEVKISGYTDNTGKESHNLRLSLQRAEVAAAHIIKLGVPWERVSFEGYGSARPIMSNDTEEGKRKNRRVEILIHERR